MFWQITDDDIAAACDGNTGAIERVYAQALEPCARVATSVSGRPDVAHNVLRELVRRSTKQFEKWSYADEASRWFMHHTIILLREHRKPLTPRDDMLLKDIGGPDVVQYVAMVNAIRKLPDQQQEAFLLTHAQRWNTRLCAIAMDCSNTAVESHLVEANRQIQPLLGEHASALLGFLNKVHLSIPIEYPSAPKIIAARIKARRGARAVRTLVGWGLVALIVAAIVWVWLVVVPKIEI